jgi:hypothetical protein
MDWPLHGLTIAWTNHCMEQTLALRSQRVRWLGAVAIVGDCWDGCGYRSVAGRQRLALLEALAKRRSLERCLP